MYIADHSEGHEVARQACLVRLTEHLLDIRALRVVLDSSDERDRIDVATLRAVLGKPGAGLMLVYEHLRGQQEELLWIADAVAWAYGAGGDWRRRMKPIVSDVFMVEHP